MEKIFKILVFALWLFPVCSNGQVQVRLTVKQISLTHPNDSLYIAGDFNSWNAGDKDFVFAKDNQGNLFINLDLPAGLHEYKLTRGSWSSVETTVEGDPIANRVLALSRDSQLTILVRAWADDFKRMPVVRKHTATAQVSILDSAFDIPQLNAKRRIWVYLPENYASTKKRYPVLYMQDGQNLFDEASSGFGEWGVDECLDSLGRQGIKKCIVIGIDSGPGRMSEYNPYDYKTTKGNANAYIDFIVNSLKPYVDKNLRTMIHKKHTFIAGSSMGGLVSFYAVMKYPDVFGGAGIFSPSFWIAPAIINDLDKAGKKMHSKLFFYAGATESTTMLSDMQNVESKLKSLSHSSLLEQVDANAKHNEAAWRKYFPVFYKWIMRK